MFVERVIGRTDKASAVRSVSRNRSDPVLFVRYGCVAAMEVEMRRMWRRFRTVVAVLLALAVGSLPACGTMGGGGMKYLADPPAEVLGSIET